MKMNVQRGVQRLWLAFSAIWAFMSLCVSAGVWYARHDWTLPDAKYIIGMAGVTVFVPVLVYIVIRLGEWAVKGFDQ